MVRKKRIVSRCRSFDRRSDAVRWAREIEAQADRLGELGDVRLASKLTLGDILMRYRDQVSPTKRGAYSERARIMGIVRRNVGGQSLAKLASADLAKYRDERLQKVTPATVLRELNLISHALDVATLEWGLPLSHNPAKLIRRPCVNNERTRRLLDGEESLLLAACDAGQTAHMKPIIIFALETGMRRGEILSLCWSDVELSRRVVHVRQSKTGASRTIPLTRRATLILQNMTSFGEAPGTPVFPLNANAVRLAFQRIRARAGISDLRFHDLRHEAISRLFERGLQMFEVAAISGHRGMRMLQRYTHLRATDLVTKLDQLS
ncbi:site-specific integrase [Pseudolabrys sp. Root1462]|uniref:site-specific integrase n=1 Tax=Pseudolabrys sp. Root1462 TaxID=1736466 RepID=UPI000B1B9B97|nr:site-specific integrase [Pseudolabrys sp. Root1462]